MSLCQCTVECSVGRCVLFVNALSPFPNICWLHNWWWPESITQVLFSAEPLRERDFQWLSVTVAYRVTISCPNMQLHSTVITRLLGCEGDQVMLDKVKIPFWSCTKLFLIFRNFLSTVSVYLLLTVVVTSVTHCPHL